MDRNLMHYELVHAIIIQFFFQKLFKSLILIKFCVCVQVYSIVWTYKKVGGTKPAWSLRMFCAALYLPIYVFDYHKEN